MKKRVMILGSTGSIGEYTLDVVRRMEDRFRVVALSCNRNEEKLLAQADFFKPEAIAIAAPDVTGSFHRGRSPLKECAGGCRVYRGEEGLLAMIEEVDADIVLNGISGSRGLLPTLKALESGKDLALANKESLVMAGGLVLETARRNDRNLIPVDSEHSALFTILRLLQRDSVEEMILTASGGAFRNLSLGELSRVRFKDALRHPTWSMGAKITVDSASMANKGLEVIEAHRLFGMSVDKITVVIHPQSYIHSLVRTVDGSLYAQVNLPDMRIPIQNALTYPAIAPNALKRFELIGSAFSFFPVDEEKYRMLAFGYQAARLSGSYPIAYNAANEVAVDAFISGSISFLDIPRVVEDTLTIGWEFTPGSLDDVLSLDNAARSEASRAIGKRKRREA